jgi:hypothetical protein
MYAANPHSISPISAKTMMPPTFGRRARINGDRSFTGFGALGVVATVSSLP